MRTKHIFVVSILLLFFPVQGYGDTVKNDSVFQTLTRDSVLSVRNAVDDMLGNLLEDWVMRYVEEDECDTTASAPLYADSVYVERLSSLPYVMEMPYNDKVRAFIDMYVMKRRQQLGTLLGLSTYDFPIFVCVYEEKYIPLHDNCKFTIKYIVN